MYGSLGTLDRHGTFSSSKPAMGGHQEQHNVLPLSMSQNRFPLLPITTQTRTHPPHMPKLQSPIHKVSWLLSFIGKVLYKLNDSRSLCN